MFSWFQSEADKIRRLKLEGDGQYDSEKAAALYTRALCPVIAAKNKGLECPVTQQEAADLHCARACCFWKLNLFRSAYRDVMDARWHCDSEQMVEMAREAEGALGRDCGLKLDPGLDDCWRDRHKHSTFDSGSAAEAPLAAKPTVTDWPMDGTVRDSVSDWPLDRTTRGSVNDWPLDQPLPVVTLASQQLLDFEGLDCFADTRVETVSRTQLVPSQQMVDAYEKNFPNKDEVQVALPFICAKKMQKLQAIVDDHTKVFSKPIIGYRAWPLGEKFARHTSPLQLLVGICRQCEKESRTGSTNNTTYTIKNVGAFLPQWYIEVVIRRVDPRPPGAAST